MLRSGHIAPLIFRKELMIKKTLSEVITLRKENLRLREENLRLKIKLERLKVDEQSSKKEIFFYLCQLLHYWQ